MNFINDNLNITMWGAHEGSSLDMNGDGGDV